MLLLCHTCQDENKLKTVVFLKDSLSETPCLYKTFTTFLIKWQSKLLKTKSEKRFNHQENILNVVTVFKCTSFPFFLLNYVPGSMTMLAAQNVWFSFFHKKQVPLCYSYGYDVLSPKHQYHVWHTSGNKIHCWKLLRKIGQCPL